MAASGAGVWRRIRETVWLALAAGLPLVMTPWAGAVFELPKALYLLVGVALLSALQAYVPEDTAARRPAATDALALAAALAEALAAAFSANPLHSIQGSYERAQGLFTQLVYLALFWLASRDFDDPRLARRLLSAAAWGSLPLTLYGLFQAAGLDPLRWRVEGSLVIGTLGRSNFMGAYLLMALALTVGRAALAGSIRGRKIYLALAVLQAVCLALTRARAAWLGTLAAGGVYLALWLRQRGRPREAAVLAGLGALALAGSVILLPLLTGLQGSLGARALIWRSAWPLVAARPLLGYGQDTFGQVFTGVYPPGLVYLQGRAVVVDRAHNLLLDSLLSIGLAGTLASGALAGAVLLGALRRIGRAAERGERIILSAGLACAAGHITETLFGFEITATAGLFWLVLGMLAARRKLPDAGAARHHAPRLAARLARRGAGAALLLAALYLAGRLALAEIYAGSAVTEGSTAAELAAAADAYQRAAALWPTQPVYQLRLGAVYLRMAQAGRESTAWAAGEQALRRAAALIPADYRPWAALGELYTEWARAGEPERYAQAQQVWVEAQRLFPGSAVLRTGRGLAYAYAGDLPAAEAQFTAAVELDQTDAAAFRYLGEVRLALGNLAGAEDAFINSLRWQPGSAAAWTGLARVYARGGRAEPMLAAYARALELAPGDAALWLEAAQSAGALGLRYAACTLAARGAAGFPGDQALRSLALACSP